MVCITNSTFATDNKSIIVIFFVRHNKAYHIRRDKTITKDGFNVYSVFLGVKQGDFILSLVRVNTMIVCIFCFFFHLIGYLMILGCGVNICKEMMLVPLTVR